MNGKRLTLRTNGQTVVNDNVELRVLYSRLPSGRGEKTDGGRDRGDWNDMAVGDIWRVDDLRVSFHEHLIFAIFA